ncbi:MAG: response regulator [Anaerolineales bacterium]|nr:response regulator [Anaerolineales bacterium]
METPFVYVVDDEPGIALLCNRLLTRAGYRVQTETSSRKALEFFNDNPIDLLLVDIRMPEVDGFEVIQNIKRLQPDAAVLIMTGHGTVETAIRALRQGVDGLLLKPFGQGSELVEAVKQAFVDSQRKRDAARIQTLRPLFSVTETLLAEKQREPLLKLILGVIQKHMRVEHVAGYQKNLNAKKYERVISSGKFPKTLTGLSASVEAASAPLLILPNAQQDANLSALLTDLELGSAILVPIQRPNIRMILWVGRNPSEPAFRESDVEMFQILAGQAVVALENSRLYAEQAEAQKALLQSEKMAAAGRLSASIAHEVNNPLQAVQNCLHLAAREDLPAEKRKEYFDLARKELERLMVTTRRMLDFYRPNANAQEKVDVQELLQYALTLMNKQFSESEVRVELDIPEELPPIMAVASQIQQVFINLALNAVDALGAKGGLLKITARPYASGVELFFEDDGPGIPKAQQANIFEPFFSTKDGGTGLGLTVSYNIVTAHGGALEYLAERDSGACFHIILPRGEQ